MAKLLSLINMLKNLDTKIPHDKDVKKVSRADFIDKYIGHTVIKTNDLLQANTDKVLFIKDAYFLFHNMYDDFGLEALMTLHDYMLNNSECPIIIMKSEDKDFLIKTLSTTLS